MPEDEDVYPGNVDDSEFETLFETKLDAAREAGPSARFELLSQLADATRAAGVTDDTFMSKMGDIELAISEIQPELALANLQLMSQERTVLLNAEPMTYREDHQDDSDCVLKLRSIGAITTFDDGPIAWMLTPLGQAMKQLLTPVVDDDMIQADEAENELDARFGDEDKIHDDGAIFRFQEPIAAEQLNEVDKHPDDGHRPPELGPLA